MHVNEIKTYKVGQHWPVEIEDMYQLFKKRLMSEFVVGLSDGVINEKIFPRFPDNEVLWPLFTKPNYCNLILIDKEKTS